MGRRSTPCLSRSLNGARSWRPGRPGFPPATRQAIMASMEPGRGDREDNRRRKHDREGDKASMEPGRGDREDMTALTESHLQMYAPQWSPVVETGKTTQALVEYLGQAEPQWSPVVETGKTRTYDAEEFGQLFEGLNGARSWRPGRLMFRRSSVPAPSSLNGARSWRPGRRAVTLTELVLIHQPQWSPVVETGKTQHRQDRTLRLGRPQWSPVVETGKTGDGLRLHRVSACLNGARSWRPGRRPERSS
ncbi:Hypothetical protein ACGLYG10_1964 [Actinomyces glycerinitolerans]|uniref:Uncharacterized protein n=1 Tax=Actinomyces glycerinitolerans TaxID=1892869 RepID=A0A1M4S0I7_9ACTO|nr:Hypothetical protein ACGLYG10_1964 [Actinomyces glycerinitolerans]